MSGSTRSSSFSDEGFSLPSRERYAPFESTELALESPLKQIQDIAGCRPVLMVGEGSHRTSEFFNLQAQIAAEAIEQGCRHLCIEIPHILGAEVNEFVNSDGRRGDIEKLVASSFYPTWSDRSIVALLQKVYDINSAQKESPITVHGVDPQVVGVKDRLSACLSTLHGEMWNKLNEVSEAWRPFAAEQSLYFDLLRNPSGSEGAEQAQFSKMQDAGKTCEDIVKSLVGEVVLTSDASKLLKAISTHLDLSSLPMQESIDKRDKLMADEILKAVPAERWGDTLKAPLAVVLAHNAHVSFGPQGEAFAHGMGAHVREGLKERGFGDSGCTVVCQVSVAGTLAFLSCDPSELRSNGNPEHQSMVEGGLGLLPSPLGGKPVLVQFCQQGEDGWNEEYELTLRQFGAISPSKKITAKIKPRAHMTFLVIHAKTSAANWLSDP